MNTNANLNQDPNLSLIQGDPKDIEHNINRLQDIEANKAAIRKEFIGKPEICHMLAEHIVHLRRAPNDVFHQGRFIELVNRYHDVLLEHYDVRWLLSICDTFVDIGDPKTAAIAMNISQCINRCNVDSTLLVNVVDGRLDTDKMAQEIKVPTWGGMITADVPHGDMIHNMMTRIDRVCANHSLLNDIWKRIKDLSRNEHGVVMNHICNASIYTHQRSFFK